VSSPVPKVSRTVICKQCVHYSMTSVRVSSETLEKLNILKGVLLKRNLEQVIIRLMLIREYDEAFFERQRQRTQGFLNTGVSK
jgi:hypothetical protein